MAALPTIDSTYLEQSVLETLARTIVARAAFIEANPTADIRGFNVTQSVNLATGTTTFQVVLPIDVTIDADGGQSYDVPEVLSV